MKAKNTDRDFLALKNHILEHRSLDCNQYKDSYLQRRFAVRMRARGVDQYKDYIRLLSSDPCECDELMRDITINVTQFFRDGPVFRELEEEILPLLIYRKAIEGKSTIRIWSAGCSSGEEPYSLAIILKELLGDEIDSFRLEIIGSDIDEEMLLSAREGRYLPRQLVNVPPTYLEQYFRLEKDMYWLDQEIKDMVKFRTIDLFRTSAGSNLDMILCRNVVIYFTREMQERLYLEFYRSLNDGGFFVMGNTETLGGEASRLFNPVKSRERIFQK